MRRPLAAALSLAALAATGCALAVPTSTTGLTGSSATLNGAVFSNRAGNTDYWWRYGTTENYGSESTHRMLAINDDQGHPVSQPVSGLGPSTTYHFQMCARDPDTAPSPVCSKDGTFTTLTPVGQRALAIAQQYRGTPFFYGGASPSTGFDDDGLVQYAFGLVGVTLPRISYQQFEVGTPVTLANLQAGDLVFFRSTAGDIYHVGIYEGGGSFFHAPHTGDVLKSNSLSEPFYAAQFAGGRRISG